MRFERVLLVNPFSTGEWRGIAPHIGQASLAQTLLSNGVDYQVLDMNLGYQPKHLLQRIKEYKPDLIGMSLISLEYKKFYGMLSEVKRLNPGLRIVVGGPHVTILKEKVLEDCPAIDYGVVYEGEGTLLELCEGNAPDKIKGLLFRDRNRIIFSGNRPVVWDLDKIPWPRYKGFELERYIREITIYSSRGCPHQCTFCPNRIISPYYRARTPNNVVDEIEYWYERGHRQFNFDDDNFNMVRERVFKICDEIERRGLKKLFLRCSNGIRADRTDHEMLTRMWEVGFRYLAFGVDGGNNRILGIVKKGETIETIERAIKIACDIGYGVKLLFVVGTPYETREDVEDKVRLSRKYPIQEVHFYNTIPYPGTEIYEWVKENKYFLRPPENYLNDISCLTREPVFETPELPKASRIELYKYLDGVRRQIHREALRRELNRGKWPGLVAGQVLANGLVERLFYQSALARRVMDNLRYRLATSR